MCREEGGRGGRFTEKKYQQPHTHSEHGRGSNQRYLVRERERDLQEYQQSRPIGISHKQTYRNTIDKRAARTYRKTWVSCAWEALRWSR